jgi:hypothetical protein
MEDGIRWVRERISREFRAALADKDHQDSFSPSFSQLWDQNGGGWDGQDGKAQLGQAAELASFAPLPSIPVRRLACHSPCQLVPGQSSRWPLLAVPNAECRPGWPPVPPSWSPIRVAYGGLIHDPRLIGPLKRASYPSAEKDVYICHRKQSP